MSEQLQNQGKSLRRVWPHKEDLDRLIELIEEFDVVLVANLLVAYGYAKWTKTKTEPPSVTDEESSKADELEDTEEE